MIPIPQPAARVYNLEELRKLTGRTLVKLREQEWFKPKRAVYLHTVSRESHERSIFIYQSPVNPSNPRETWSESIRLNFRAGIIFLPGFEFDFSGMQDIFPAATELYARYTDLLNSLGVSR